MTDLNFLSPNPNGIRVIGDVHGDFDAFCYAIETDRFIIQLGDLTDYGPRSADVLCLMDRLLSRKRGLFLAGNHDRKLGLALLGRNVQISHDLAATLEQLDNPQNQQLRQRTLHNIQSAPAWLILDRMIFVHGAFHPLMLQRRPPPVLGRLTPALAHAFFGKALKGLAGNGYPPRSLGWVHQIPSPYTVYCGHDQRSPDGRPWTMTGRNGGTAVFMDTGAGKGGHLSWVDLPPLCRE